MSHMRSALGDGQEEDYTTGIDLDATDLRNLALSPEDFKGRQVSVSARINGPSMSMTGYVFLLEAAVSSNIPLEVAAQFHEDPSLADGQFVTVRGTCDGIHIITNPNLAG